MPTAPPSHRATRPLKRDRDSWIAGYDGLRAIAALAVFGVHLHAFIAPVDATLGPIEVGRAMLNGNTGVAVFFMLSAFLLSQPFWGTQSDAGRRLLPRSYALRRAARILPAYYLCLIGLVVARGMFAGGELTTALLHAVFLHNFAEFAIYGINDPFWTIAVQVQFYLVLPVLLGMLWPVCHGRHGRDGRGTGGGRVLAVAGFLMLSVAAYWLHRRVMLGAEAAGDWTFDPEVLRRPSEGFVISHSLLAHLPHFLLGIAAGGVYAMLRSRAKPGHSDAPDRARGSRRPTRELRSSGAEAGAVSGRGSGGKSGASECPGLGGYVMCDVLVIGAMVGILAIVSTPLDDALRITLPNDPAVDIGRYNWPAVPLLIAVVLIGVPFTRITKAVLDVAPLRWLGVISYGFYLYHLPCQELTARVMAGRGMEPSGHWAMFTAASLALAVGVSIVSWFAVERPIIRWAHGGKRGRLVGAPHRDRR